MEQLTWRKSSRSGTGNCVEVAVLADRVMIRDSKDPEGPRLAITPAEWRNFLRTLN